METKQPQEYRGVILPDGMTPECLSELTRLLYQCEGEVHPPELAAMVFKVVIRHLQGREIPQ